MTHQNKHTKILPPVIRQTLLLASFFMLTVNTGCSMRTKVESSTFQTRINESKLKHFIVSTPAQPAKITQKRNQQYQTNPRRSAEARRDKKTEQQLLKIAEIKITTTQFCSTGYWVIETSPRAYTFDKQPFLRGECNELATETDIDNFPNQFKHW